MFRQDEAKRLDETRRIFDRPVLAVDIHTHSLHSDGRDSVSDNYAAAEQAGLDFMFATDHLSLRQKRNVRNLPHASWGQEPGAGGHHIGLLHGRRLFRPGCRSLAEDFEAARKLAEFAWIPHPTGWYPKMIYSDERIQQLWTIGDAFAMEILNGANKLFRAHDIFAEKAAVIWERLLCDGRQVTPLGSSDAHCSSEIGIAWTGIYAAHRNAPAILRALNAGACFASESSLLELYCAGQPMGAAVRRVGKVRPLPISFRVADAGGIKTARLIAGGKVIRTFNGQGRTLLSGALELRVNRRAGYLRLETETEDDRRAFSAPIYL